MRLDHLSAILAIFVSSVVWASEASSKKPVPIQVDAPEYPAIARRYNVSGEVLAKIRIETDGHVSKTEIIASPADVLSEAAIKATSRWRYQPMEEATEGVARLPFQLDGGDYAFSTSVRRLVSPAPESATDLGVELDEGWSHVRLLIDATGAVTGELVLKSSGPEFNPSQNAILAALRFSPAPDGVRGMKTTTVNLFFIRVVPGGEVRFSQLPGT